MDQTGGGISVNTTVTEPSVQAGQGDAGSFSRLFTLLYNDFRALARSRLRAEPHIRTLQPTALVNELYLKLVDQTRVEWKNRTHFFAVGALAMRRILLNHAVAAQRHKRGGPGTIRVQLDEELLSTQSQEAVLAVHEALKELAKLNQRHARIVELRVFGGLTSSEIAEELGVSVSTVEKDWRFSTAWLRHALRR